MKKKIVRIVAMLYMFANLFNVWLYWKEGFSYLLPHSIFYDMLFWLKHMKKIQPHRNCTGLREGNFNSLCR